MKLGDIFSQKAVLENKLRNIEENFRALEVAYKRELEANERLAQNLANIKADTIYSDTGDARDCSRGRDKRIKTLKRKFKRQIESERAMHKAAYSLLDQKFCEHLDSIRCEGQKEITGVLHINVDADAGKPLSFVNGKGEILRTMPVTIDNKLPNDVIKLVSGQPTSQSADLAQLKNSNDGVLLARMPLFRQWECQQCGSIIAKDNPPVACEVGCPQPEWRELKPKNKLYVVKGISDNGVTQVAASASYSYICQNHWCWNIACFGEVNRGFSTAPIYCEEHAIALTSNNENYQLYRVECVG